MTWRLSSPFLTRIQFHSIKVTPLTNLDEVTAEELCYCYSNAWGWHNSYHSGVIGITDQIILQNGKNLRCIQEEQYRAQNTALLTRR